MTIRLYYLLIKNIEVLILTKKLTIMKVKLIAVKEDGTTTTGGHAEVDMPLVPRIGDVIRTIDMGELYNDDEVSPHWEVVQIELRCSNATDAYEGIFSIFEGVFVYVKNIDF